MKTAIAILYSISWALMISLPLTAAPAAPAHLRVIAARNAAPPAGYTYELDEDFEAPGYETSWAETGASQDDQYSGGNQLEGTYSYRNYPAAATAYSLGASFGDENTTTTCFMLKFATQANFVPIMYGLTGAGGSTWQIVWGSSAGKIRIQHGSTQSANSTATLSAGTLYYIWYEYEKGTGANGKARIYISTTSTKPAADITQTTGNGTAAHGRIRLGYTSSTTQEFICDHIRIVADATSVTDWPP